VALTDGAPIETAIPFACAAASLSVTRAGAQPSMPARRDVEAFLGGRREPL
jgi:ribokinase